MLPQAHKGHHDVETTEAVHTFRGFMGFMGSLFTQQSGCSGLPGLSISQQRETEIAGIAISHVHAFQKG